MIEATRLLLHKHAQELRDTWQCRCLAESTGKLRAVVLSVLMHSYTQAVPILLRVAFPGFRDIMRPFIASAATIILNGKVGCEIVPKSGIRSWMVIYDSEGELIKDFRDLADRLKLRDAERIELTAAVKRWVVADLRVNHMGEQAVA